jgi:hypothetical protein
MTRRLTLRAAALACWILAVPAFGYGQAAQEGSGVEIIAGVRYVRAVQLGDADANEARPGGGTFTLFTTSTTLRSARGVEAGVGFRITPTLHLRAIGSYAAADLETMIDSDAEGIPDSRATESIRQFAVEGTVAWDLAQYGSGSRIVPFVSAGGGYLRELHEGNALAETGATAHLGGGATVRLATRPQARMRSLGLRAEARALLRRGGVAFDDGIHVGPAFTASLFFGF